MPRIPHILLFACLVVLPASLAYISYSGGKIDLTVKEIHISMDRQSN